MLHMFSGKRAVTVLGVIVIVVVGMFLYWLVTKTSEKKECRKDTDCGEGFYCGSDYSCHEFKVIEKTVVQYNLLGPSIILGISIIIAARILRTRNYPN
ncbi:MAG: hypothetical protein QXK37_05840 [Candidatus Woesearchaeota archaeon]